MRYALGHRGHAEMKDRVRALALALILFLFATQPADAAGERMYVIAKSISTGVEARNILVQNNWVESNLRDADFALVVVRSMLRNPISSFSDDIFEIEDEADRQLNISGSNFVVYIYALDENLRPTLVQQTDYPATD